jgi:hypothetical protein
MSDLKGLLGPADPFWPTDVALQSMALSGPQIAVPGNYWWLRADHPGGTGLAEAWGLATGAGVRISVLDSGVNWTCTGSVPVGCSC